MAKITLYGAAQSGHTHRVALLLRMLNLHYEFIIASAETRRSAFFLQLNSFGQIPVLQDGELYLSDSNAIMVYLVKRYAPNSHWLPEEALAAANVQLWLSKAAGEVRYGPASTRMVTQFSAAEDYPSAISITNRFLPLLEQHVADRQFLATHQATIGDLACYSYVAAAPEGGVTLAPYPAIRRWLARIEALPGFFAMPPLPLPNNVG